MLSMRRGVLTERGRVAGEEELAAVAEAVRERDHVEWLSSDVEREQACLVRGLHHKQQSTLLFAIVCSIGTI